MKLYITSVPRLKLYTILNPHCCWQCRTSRISTFLLLQPPRASFSYIECKLFIQRDRSMTFLSNVILSRYPNGSWPEAFSNSVTISALWARAQNSILRYGPQYQTNYRSAEQRQIIIKTWQIRTRNNDAKKCTYINNTNQDVCSPSVKSVVSVRTLCSPQWPVANSWLN